MTKEMGTAPMEEVVIRPLIEEAMIGDVPQVPIRGTGVAPTMDMDPFQILDQREGAVLNMEEPKALSMTDTTAVRLLQTKDLDLEKEEQLLVAFDSIYCHHFPLQISPTVIQLAFGKLEVECSIVRICGYAF